MARKVYSAGDMIYLGQLENGKITVMPVLLVSLVSVSVDGEMWRVRISESGQMHDHFIRYPDDEEEACSQ